MHRIARTPNYERRPFVAVGQRSECAVGLAAVAERLRAKQARVIVVETYPGTDEDEIRALGRQLRADHLIRSADALLPPAAIERIVAPDLTEDPVFGRITERSLGDLFDRSALERLTRRVADAVALGQTVVVCGTGASLITDGDLLVYADMPRWEIQRRQRSGTCGNLGVDNRDASAAAKYKRGYFFDWRIADRHKFALFPRVDFLLDTTDPGSPRMVAGDVIRHGLATATSRPFRVVPFFDPAPWGGQWMKTVCDLPRDVANYGWCFDCVPEENSLLLGFDDLRFELPASDLVASHPLELLGRAVARRFEGEFPIRFDLLDTMQGGNLSLQVHPRTAYMREHFGVHYTQDESYYMLDADADASVYLGVKRGIDPDRMIAELRRAEAGGDPFEADLYVNRFPAHRHDHFLIPAGTVHCSGAGGVVLEISATPYIFTFKLWDWARPGLDGKPRPVHIGHGARNIRYERDRDYALARLINRVTPLASGRGWRSERTGLHEAEFLETHRHWFSGPAPHDTGGTVNVLNLVGGEQATVESPDGAFEPFVVHYAETFIVPAAVGPYSVRPSGPDAEREHVTIKAFVRDSADSANPLAG